MNKTGTNQLYDCIVIGGGISGISFAYYLHSIGKTVLIIEKEDNIGGQIRSEISHTDNTYWRELGAHTCYNSYTYFLSLLEQAGCIGDIVGFEKYKYLLYSSGKMKSIFSELSLLPMIFNCPKAFFATRGDKSVKEYFRPIVGASNYDHLFTHAFKAVISQNADDYPAELFLKKRKERRKDIPRKFSSKKGLSSFLDSIISKNNIPVINTMQVVDIQQKTVKEIADTGSSHLNPSDKAYEVITNKGVSFYAKNIAVAADPQSTSALLKNIDKPLSDLLSNIPLFHSESLNIIVRKEKLSVQNMAGIIPLSNDFFSAVSRDLLDHPHFRSFTFHFEAGKKSREEQLSLICTVLGISQSDIPETKLMTHVLPTLRKEHLHLTEKVEAKRTNKDIYVLGNYFYGLSIEDCVRRAHLEFERYSKINQ